MEEYGVELYLVPEGYTSTECTICGEVHSNSRVHRGLYVCRRTGKKFNSDLNASSNMARRTGYKVEVERILGYVVTHKGLKPIFPRGGVTPLDPGGRGNSAPSRAGRGHVSLRIPPQLGCHVLL